MQRRSEQILVWQRSNRILACFQNSLGYNRDMLPDVATDEPIEVPRRRSRRPQFSLRKMLAVIGGIWTVFSAIHWVPGLGAALLVLLGWILPAVVVLGVLIVLQLPLMLLSRSWSDSQRKRRRDERQVFLVRR